MCLILILLLSIPSFLAYSYEPDSQDNKPIIGIAFSTNNDIGLGDDQGPTGGVQLSYKMIIPRGVSGDRERISLNWDSQLYTKNIDRLPGAPYQNGDRQY